MRLAKHVWSSADCQGRLAVVPPGLISHLAERSVISILSSVLPPSLSAYFRQAESCSVADSSILDTVALLAWVTANIVETDKHNIATQALSAAQILQVRNNRQQTPQ